MKTSGIPQIYNCGLFGMGEEKDSAYTDESVDESDVSSSEWDRKKDRLHAEYVCEYCQLTFRKNAKYIRHLRTHTKEVGIVFGNDTIETIFMFPSRVWKVI